MSGATPLRKGSVLKQSSASGLRNCARSLRSGAAPLTACFLLAGAAQAAPAADEVLRVGVHIHSSVSTGTQTVEEITAAAQATGVDALIFSDSAQRKWEYGVGPGRLIKRIVEQPSVLTLGPDRYALQIVDAAAATRILALPGVEAAPFYFWRRSPFDKRGGQIKGWHQHLLVFGLPQFSSVKALPLENNPYQGSQGARPYQALIDAVRAQDGLVYWAHPETPYTGSHGGIEEFTEAYPHLLETTQGYHGFALTYLGALTLVEPGGLWDRLLQAYVTGQRAEPAWIIGELDWHDSARPMDSVLTHVQAASRTPAALLQGLRQGACWVVFRTARGDLPTLSHFSVTGGRVQVQIHVPAHESQMTTVQIIKDGAVVHTAEQLGSGIDAVWTDPAPLARGYYRVIARAGTGLIYTNPIFVGQALPTTGRKP